MKVNVSALILIENLRLKLLPAFFLNQFLEKVQVFKKLFNFLKVSHEI